SSGSNSGNCSRESSTSKPSSASAASRSSRPAIFATISSPPCGFASSTRTARRGASARNASARGRASARARASARGATPPARSHHKGSRSSSDERGSLKGATRTQPRTPQAPVMRPTTIGSVGSGCSPAPGCGNSGGDPGRGSGGGRLLGRVATRESRDGRRQRRAPLFPVFETIDGELQSRLVTGGNRVVEPEALDEFAVAPAALVRRDDVIEGALLGTTARQADDNH